ncbi:hypothetical protein J5N97_021174 [Dioscorea zingiberensis]|uniref:Uncharacterized protein n=1 Tax=Dioscorea zingiberensis TaxID=325984 RepID=A0A9D5HEB5_9LILI|nr:hypothetical protein J5N97_021174 [Dioscorea zingiberensis]
MAAPIDPSSATSTDHQIKSSSSSSGAPRWVKAWVPQDIKVTGGKCSLLRWIKEDKLEAIMKEQEKEKETETKEPTREILYLCSHEGCGRTFKDPESIRKHAQIHKTGKQCICPHKDCAAVKALSSCFLQFHDLIANLLYFSNIFIFDLQKFSDNSKLERHMYVHTKIKNHICDHEGCGKAFSFQFNLNSHKKTHCDENYHYCPTDGCKKRFTEEYKLTNHINSCHQKNDTKVMRKHQSKDGSAVKKDSSEDYPYSCPHTGCDKAYKHEYKLRLHLENKHQLEGDASNLNADTVKDSSSKKSKKRQLDSTFGTLIRKLVNPRATLDLQTSTEANNKFRIQRKDEDGCKEVEEQKEHEGVVEGEDGYDSEETVDDDRSYVILNYVLENLQQYVDCLSSINRYMGRPPCCEKAHTNKGAWTKEEDQRLISYIRANGEGCWRSLPKAAGLLRCGKSCRLRWINYLRPDLKRGNFTEEEDELIIKLHGLLGNKWSLIAGRLPGRTDNEIKNYWNTHIKRKLIGRGIDPQTHRPLGGEEEKHGIKAKNTTYDNELINLDLSISLPYDDHQPQPPSPNSLDQAAGITSSTPQPVLCLCCHLGFQTSSTSTEGCNCNAIQKQSVLRYYRT